MEQLPYLSIQEHVQCSEPWADHPGKNDREEVWYSLHNWASSDTEFTLHVQRLQTWILSEETHAAVLLTSMFCLRTANASCNLPPASCCALYSHDIWNEKPDNPRVESLDSSHLPSVENKHC